MPLIKQGATIEPPPEKLYHYCGVSAFRKILKTKKLWLGRLSAMNDSMEFTWLRRIAVEAIEARLAVESVDERPAHIQAWRNEFYAHLMRLLQEDVYSDPYCVCFSEDGDSLGQWRSYARDGHGFAIGFRSDALEFPYDGNYSSVVPPTKNPVKVIYDKVEHVKRIDDDIVYVEILSHFQNDTGDKPDIESLAREAYQLLLHSSMFCKNPKFVDEAEYRVVHDPELASATKGSADRKSIRLLAGPQPLKSRFIERGETLRQFLVLPFDDRFGEKSIVEVVLGPKNSSKLDQRVLRAFLNANGLGHVNIRASEATYR